MPWDRNQMAARAAQELQDGWYVNLGIGIPTLVSNYIPEGVEVTLQSENGMLGMGPFPIEGEEDADLINAGKQTITELPQTALFRQRHVLRHDPGRQDRDGDPGRDGSVRKGRSGELDDPRQAGQGHGRRDGSGRGRQAAWWWSWITPTRPAKARCCRNCTLPLTGKAVVDRIITNLGVLDVVEGGLKIVETADGVTEDELRAATLAKIVN